MTDAIQAHVIDITTIDSEKGLAWDPNLTKEEQIEIIKFWHETHYCLGARRLFELFRRVTNSPPKRDLIERTIESCEKCEAQKKLVPSTAVAKIPFPDRPGEEIAIDHFKP